MRDVQDAYALLANRPHDLVEPLDLRLRHGGRWFVQHQYGHVAAGALQRPSDRYGGLLDRLEFVHGLTDVDLVAHRPDSGLRRLPLPSPADPATDARGIAVAERKVVDNGECGDQAQVLMDELHAGLVDVVGVAKLAWLPVDERAGSGVRPVESREDLD